MLAGVALRKESVDRNILPTPTSQTSSVALRKESVDRNAVRLFRLAGAGRSLSARRAWIEMLESLNVNALKSCRSPQGERG